MLSKDFFPFLISSLLFLATLIFSLNVYVHWDDPVEKPISLIEVNLPIIDWESYSNLSKTYPPDMVKKME